MAVRWGQLVACWRADRLDAAAGVAEHKRSEAEPRSAGAEQAAARARGETIAPSPIGDGFAVSLHGFGGGFGVVSRRFFDGFAVVSISPLRDGFGMVSEGSPKPSFDQPCVGLVASDMIGRDELAPML
jgi:hypothetical protein